ncbi:hypothetical protein H4R26_003145 [Coemansia thaxteri]|uniref:Uncharacterized protein n=1 Tax=Coemansia thaxteri TaxID=2663907 RepID=A0A9W8BF46_9FUNG|nr:hypothetical protein H4R26_003145 [Coemansia thaxteri]
MVSGSSHRTSDPSDTCTILWLKALDKSLSEWIASLRELPAKSKEYARAANNIRSIVSKLLPTRILTFEHAMASADLSKLASYYSVFLFFLHAIPSDVVRAERLYTQLQAMLRFKESSSLTARRVYFEAWSAAATIIALSLSKALRRCGSVGAIRAVEKMAASGTAQGVGLREVDDYYRAMLAAVAGWSESLGVVLSECAASGQHLAGANIAPAAALWELADAALMYLARVLASSVVSEHVPTLLLLVLATLKSRPVLSLAVASFATTAYSAVHTMLLRRLLAVVRVWQRAVAATPLPPTGEIYASSRGTTGSDGLPGAEQGGGDSQLDFAMFDSAELQDIAAEAEELERRAPFAAIDAAIVQVVHEQYIPGLRQHIVQRFSSLSASSSAVAAAELGERQHMRGLELAIQMLAHMVSACVDAGLRTWESFLDEYGRDNLYLIPDSYGRRLVLAQFAVAAISVSRGKGQAMERLDVALKDVWFATVCDLRLTAYSEQLAALLAWSDDKMAAAQPAATPANAALLAVFAGGLLPAHKHVVEQRQGTLRDRAVDSDAAEGGGASEWKQEAAALAVSLVDRVLKNMAEGLGTAGMHKQVLASWVMRLLSTQQEVQTESRRRLHGVSDARKLVDTMAERVTLLVRGTCAELLPPHQSISAPEHKQAK